MKKILLITLSSILISCGTNYNISNKLISKEQTRDLTNRYLELRAPLVNNSIGREDSNAAWYSIEELEAYIAYIKDQSQQKGYVIEGIRFFQGVYPNNQQQYGEKAGLTTLVLVPTGIVSADKKLVSKNVESNKSKTVNNIQSVDSPNINEIESMDFSGMGHPPRVVYE